MAKSLFWLTDEAWKALDPHLPRGKPGKPRVDDRTVISGILHVLKTGCRACTHRRALWRAGFKINVRSLEQSGSDADVSRCQEMTQLGHSPAPHLRGAPCRPSHLPPSKSNCFGPRRIGGLATKCPLFSG